MSLIRGQSEQQWENTSKKRHRDKNSPEIHRTTKKQTVIRHYWLNKATEIPTSNSFQPLSRDDMLEIEEPVNPSLKQFKAPSIFVSGVQNIKPLHDLLDEIAQGCYTLKITKSDQVKIQTNKTEKYLPIVTALKEKNTEYFTYQRKEGRNFRVVLRNLHPSVEPQDIRDELEAKGHKVCRINNVKHRTSKEPLPLFFTELENKDNNKDIYKIDLLLHTKVIFEQPHKKREIPQCMRCQQYGHTKSYCNKSPKCAKCAQNHLTHNCPIKEKNGKVTCANCGENHPANYKGCAIYKQLRQKIFPALRKKYNEEKLLTTQAKSSPDKINQLGDMVQPGNLVQPGKSYARCVSGISANPTSLQQQGTNSMITEKELNNQHTKKLEEMIINLITKMDSMFNLLTTLIAKMP